MKVIDFENREYNWPPTGHEVNLDDRRKRSELHIRCRNLLKKLYPTQSVLEEVPLPGTKLRLDFYLPMRQVCIEVHGEQHYKFVKLFHGNPLGFITSKRNDSLKIEWCDMNNLPVIELPFNETDNEWRERIIEG